MFSFFALQLCANFKLAIFGLVSRNTVFIISTPIIALITALTGTIREIDCKRVDFPDIFSVMQMGVMMGVLMKTGFLGFTTGMHKLGFSQCSFLSGMHNLYQKKSTVGWYQQEALQPVVLGFQSCIVSAPNHKPDKSSDVAVGTKLPCFVPAGTSELLSGPTVLTMQIRNSTNHRLIQILLV